MKNKHIILLLILIAGLNALAILYFFSESIERSDTIRYVQTIEYFWGKTAQPSLASLVKPLSVMTASLIAPLTTPRGALFLQNLFFYFASIILVFKIIERLYFNRKQAFYGAVLFMASFPVLANGLAFLTDMTGWFFCLLVSYLTLRFYSKPNLKIALLAGFLSGIGFLFKESGGAGAVLFVFLILISKKFLWREKIRYGFIFSLCMVAPILLSVFWIAHAFDYSYLDWYKANLASGNKNYNLINIIQQLAIMFLLGWVFVLRGVWLEWKEKQEINERKLILSAMIPLFFIGFLWPMPVARVLFLGILPLLLLASRGLIIRGKTWLELSLLSLFVIVNYSLPNIFSIADLDKWLVLILSKI